MNLDPTLRGSDRIGSLVIGVALVAYALLGDLDRVLVQAALVILGLTLAAGGFGGT